MFLHTFGNKIQQFYGGKGSFFFEALYQPVNQQALAPFFRLWLHGKGLFWMPVRVPVIWRRQWA